MIKSICYCFIILGFISAAQAEMPSIEDIPDDLNAPEFKNPIFAAPMEPYSSATGNLLLTPTKIIDVETQDFSPCHILKQNDTAVLMECDAYDPALSLDKSKIKKDHKLLFKKWNLFVSIGKAYPSSKYCKIVHYYDIFYSDSIFKPFSIGSSHTFQGIKQEDCGPTQEVSF